MFFQQFQVDGLGCFSYMIGCPGSGTACVIDPERFVDQYLDVARKHDLRITHIFDTHLHADHISGSVELAERTGALIGVHPGVAPRFAHMELREGMDFLFGAAQISILETPGHTPNSITLAVKDLTRADEVQMLLTGDLLFVGDVGRPDLAGEDLLEQQVRNLYESLYDRLKPFPDWVEIYPAHGQGSLCGKGMSAKPMSTLGFERRHNPLLNGMPFDNFRVQMIGSFQLRPSNFESIVNRNRTIDTRLAGIVPMRKLAVDQLVKAMDEDVVIVDIRPATSFGAAFIPGALNIGLTAGSANWLGVIVPAHREIVLISQGEKDALDAARQFRRVGYDRIIGYLDSGVSAWAASGRSLDHLPQLSAEGLHEVCRKYPDHLLLDVRNDDEWESGHIECARHFPLNRLLEESSDLPADRHMTMVCASGYRANIAGSILKSRGHRHVYTLLGGMTAWQARERDASGEDLH